MAHYFTDNADLRTNRMVHDFTIQNTTFSFTTDHGVFSKTGVDAGSAIFLKALLLEPIHGSLLDMGCGYGVLSIVIKHFFPTTKVLGVDINPRAVSLSIDNAKMNHVDVAFEHSDGFERIRDTYTTIITNPPIRTGKANIYGMFESAFDHLEKDGTLYVVIRKQQGAQSAQHKIMDVFGNCTCIEKEKGYWILKAKRLD